MIRWLTCAATVCVTVLVLISGSVLIGRAAPARADTRMAQFGFAMCGDQPCYDGILPGTAWYEPEFVAMRRTRNCHEGDVGCGYFVGQTIPIFFDKIYKEDKPHLYVITLDLLGNVQNLYFEDVLRLYGVPCKLRIFREAQFALLMSDYGMIYIRLADGRIDLESRVMVFQLYQPNWCNGRLGADEYWWHGFASVDSYLRYEPVEQTQP